MINYNEFLENRFDLVIRYHIFESVNFGIDEAYLDSISNKYNDIKNVCGNLLETDIKKPRVNKKSKHVSKSNYGHHVMEKLFLPWNLFWIEKQMTTSDNWLKSKPYPVNLEHIGISVKRFIIALKHNKKLYWSLVDRPQLEVLELWKESNYKKLLKDKTWNKIEKSKNNLLERMSSLDFFSEDTHIGGIYE